MIKPPTHKLKEKCEGLDLVGGQPRNSRLYSRSTKFRKDHDRKNAIFRQNRSHSNGRISAPPGRLELNFFFRDPGSCPEMMMPRLWLDEPLARRHFRCQLTRVSKIEVFSQLEPFAKLRNRIRFPKFQMPYGSFFDAVHKNAVEIGFREISFFAIFKRIPGFWPEKKSPLYNLVGTDLPSTNVPSVRPEPRPLPPLRQP